MKRSVKDIEPIPTSHNAGMKRVLLAANESENPITQIAITDLCAGEIAEAHVHEDMQEGFYVLSGELDIVLDGQIEHCKAEDFVWVKCGTSHELRAITDVRVMTIGCESRI
jgi:mannose-6-phosphate isomerase-like protein (cupin superfamily)